MPIMIAMIGIESAKMLSTSVVMGFLCVWSE
jgi:hypothetical protein